MIYIVGESGFYNNAYSCTHHVWRHLGKSGLWVEKKNRLWPYAARSVGRL